MHTPFGDVDASVICTDRKKSGDAKCYFNGKFLNKLKKNPS
jgi:hypothetical protein